MYTFKAWQELFWLVLVAVVTMLAQLLATTDPSLVTDWRAWVISAAAALARAALGAVLAWVGKQPPKG